MGLTNEQKVYAVNSAMRELGQEYQDLGKYEGKDQEVTDLVANKRDNITGRIDKYVEYLSEVELEEKGTSKAKLEELTDIKNMIEETYDIHVFIEETFDTELDRFVTYLGVCRHDLADASVYIYEDETYEDMTKYMDEGSIIHSNALYGTLTYLIKLGYNQ